MSNLKISLIMCTIGRTDDVHKFIESLKNQTYNNFELIIVDQNEDNRISDILNFFPEIKEKTIHVKSEKGLSKARNVGLKYITGNIYAFPDDDCLYGNDVLLNVNEFFKNNSNYHVYSTNTCDPYNNKFSLISAPTENIEFDRNKLQGCSFTLFFKREEQLIYFDERMGVGSGFIWGSAEENDYLYRYLDNIKLGYFDKDVFVYHPAKENESVDWSRAYYYGGGLAAFRAKHFSKFRILKSTVYLIFQIIDALITFKFKKAFFKIGYLLGFLVGLISWKIAIR